MNEKISANKHAYNYIKKKILNGELKANDKINELKFSKEMNVSRTPLREALRNLEADGLVEYITNKGVFVKDIKEVNLNEVFYLRFMIETYVYIQAYKKIKDDEILELKTLIEEMNEALSNGDYQQINNLFKIYQQRIIKIAATNIAGGFLDNLDDYQKIIRNHNFNSINERLIEAINEQSRITELFSQENINLFEISVKAHILNAQHYFNKQILTK